MLRETGLDQINTVGELLAQDAVNGAELGATFGVRIGDNRPMTIGVELGDTALLRLKGGWYPISGQEFKRALRRRYGLGEAIGRGSYQVRLRVHRDEFFYDDGMGKIRSSMGSIWLVQAERLAD